jgi:hypothetical protein
VDAAGTALTKDQHGVNRPDLDGVVDIGAYEYSHHLTGTQGLPDGPASSGRSNNSPPAAPVASQPLVFAPGATDSSSSALTSSLRAGSRDAVSVMDNTLSLDNFHPSDGLNVLLGGSGMNTLIGHGAVDRALGTHWREFERNGLPRKGTRRGRRTCWDKMAEGNT